MKFWPIWTGMLAAFLMAPAAFAADHRDSPGPLGDPAMDINDVYTFTSGNSVIVAMTVFPIADTMSQFSPSAQYVFNLDTGAVFGETAESLKILCTFDEAQTASCWMGQPGAAPMEYITGDATASEGIGSASNRFRVFAGLRADPFYFNLEGFNDAVLAVEAAAPMLTFDPAGCPNVDMPTSTALVGLLQSTMGGAGPAADFFGSLNTLAIVASFDAGLLNQEHNFLTVWASTHHAP